MRRIRQGGGGGVTLHQGKKDPVETFNFQVIFHTSQLSKVKVQDFELTHLSFTLNRIPSMTRYDTANIVDNFVFSPNFVFFCIFTLPTPHPMNMTTRPIRQSIYV